MNSIRVKPIESSFNWEVTTKYLKPPEQELVALQTWLSEREGDDLLVKFIFVQPGESPISILSSRLEFAGGPLAALLNVPFKEKNTREVKLSSEDDPQSFQVIRHFLYKRKICLQNENGLQFVDLDSVIKFILSAHRWQLDALVYALVEYVQLNDMICCLKDVLQLVKVFELPHIFSRNASDYFWTSVGHYYKDICAKPSICTSTATNKNKDVEITTNEADKTTLQPYCPLFPNLWELAFSQPPSAVRNVLTSMMMKIESINDAKDSLSSSDIRNLVLNYLESRISDDDQLIELIDLLNLFDPNLTKIFEDLDLYNKYSSRAIYLLARALHRENANQMKLTWSIDIFRLQTVNGFKTSFLGPSAILSSDPIPYRSMHGLDNMNSESHTAVEVINGVLFTLKIGTYSGFQARLSWNIIPKNKLPNPFSVLLDLIEDKCQCYKDRYKKSKLRSVSSRSSSSPSDYDSQACLDIDERFLSDYRRRHKQTCRVSLQATIWILDERHATVLS